jgi:hypothetical protein
LPDFSLPQAGASIERAADHMTGAEIASKTIAMSNPLWPELLQKFPASAKTKLCA